MIEVYDKKPSKIFKYNPDRKVFKFCCPDIKNLKYYIAGKDIDKKTGCIRTMLHLSTGRFSNDCGYVHSSIDTGYYIYFKRELVSNITSKNMCFEYIDSYDADDIVTGDRIIVYKYAIQL